ncbi:NifB/NifX family molybdenum-iron cluster-binding protein, partial [candidate division KSB1 bacterium]|nr:NifB/NifX family molybdenum-iron cluster-binding protein [candidate division KSB1 bacterium]
ARFGRSPWFVVVDSDTLEFEAIENPNTAAGGGAGIQSAQLLGSHNVKAILTGNCGPNAFQVFNAAGIEVITGVEGTIRAAVQQYRDGVLKSTSSANVGSHFGMRRGTKK